MERAGDSLRIVSMSFDHSLDPIRDAIKKGIIDAEFSPEFMDEMIHNEQIVPEMFRLIRECRFLIMDISYPNYGAYYEAGYASGCGKQVIIACKKENYNSDMLCIGSNRLIFIGIMGYILDGDRQWV